MNSFMTALRSGKVLLMDGAMGTEVLRRQRDRGIDSIEGLNLIEPALIRSIHQSYLDAGAEVLLTNTFQANPRVMASTRFSAWHSHVWKAGIDLAKGDGSSNRFVLADIGPIDKISRKISTTLLADCAGVDGILLETWSSTAALKWFADRPDPPLLASFTFRRTSDLMTMTKASPEACAEAAQRCGAQAIGANCGKEIGMEDFAELVRRYRKACDLPIFVRPNAGSPTHRGRRYPRSPATMAVGLIPLLESGVAMVGGCCGTTPAHIQAFRQVIDDWNRSKFEKSN